MLHSFYDGPGLLAAIHATAALGTADSMIEWRHFRSRGKVLGDALTAKLHVPRGGVPVLAIAPQIPVVEIGGEHFQETHPAKLFRECSVYCQLVSVPEQLPRILQIARTRLKRTS